MQRSAALTTPSHDHHHALDVARRLRRAGPQDLDAARTSPLEFWEPRGGATSRSRNGSCSRRSPMPIPNGTPEVARLGAAIEREERR